MAEINWTDVLEDGLIFKASLEDPPHPPRRAHIQVVPAGPRAGAWWWVDGDDDMRHAADLDEAKAAAAQALQGLGGDDQTRNGAGRSEGGIPSRVTAEPVGSILVHGEEGGDRPDPRAAAARAVGLAIEGIERETRPAIERPRSLLATLAAAGPADVRHQLAGRLERVEGFERAVRELADEGADPELVKVLLAEADGAAEDLAEATLQVRRELQRERLVAAAIREALTGEVAAARAREKMIEGQIDRLDESILRKLCEVAGTGDTSALKLTTGRIALYKKPASVELEEGFDARLLDERFQRVPPIEPDKLAIRAALEAGEAVPGCRLSKPATRVEVKS